MRHDIPLAFAKKNYYFHKRELKKWKRIIDTFVPQTKEDILIDKLREGHREFILCTNDRAVIEAYKKMTKTT